ncbi:MAG: tetratricopeptide repeat protein [Pseudomonadota bacterium]|nr:tetratricopeptide repeat protein [Pseudomonadota bacterium]
MLSGVTRQRKKAIHMVPRSPHPRSRLASNLAALSLTFLLGAAGEAAMAQTAPDAAESTAAPSAGAATTRPLTAELVYRMLVGDIALQRGAPALAARAYFEAARDAQDAGLARRATEVALFARQRDLALEAARLWAKLDPTADRARQMVATLSLPGAGGDLKAELERVLAEAGADAKTLGDAFVQLNQALAAQTDKNIVYRLISELAKPYPSVAEAHFAVALAGYNTGLSDLEISAASVREADRALELKPGWERAALMKADILAKTSPDGAIRYLNSFLASAPESRAATGALAQLYVEQKRFAEARGLFQRLLDEDKSDRDIQFAVAAISVQMKDYVTAERIFEELRSAGVDASSVAFYLGQIAEETKRYDEAIARYREVSEGERAWIATLRIATVLAKKGDMDAARRYLASLKPEGRERAIELHQAEAQLLRDAGDYNGAYTVLSSALDADPDSAELIYDVAMVAEKLDRLDEVESRLTRLIELKPDNPQALNALGYTLVDRTPRTAEGLKLIEKALKLAPEDPSILDSMGWAYFRMGNLGDSEKFLRRALADRPDPEIAAHLGEVLWAKGERDHARQVWQSQLKETPDNALLLETVRRLAP